MKITRIGSDKDLDIETEMIDLVIDGEEFRLTNKNGELIIHSKSGEPLNARRCE